MTFIVLARLSVDFETMPASSAYSTMRSTLRSARFPTPARLNAIEMDKALHHAFVLGEANEDETLSGEKHVENSNGDRKHSCRIPCITLHRSVFSQSSVRTRAPMPS